MKIGVYVGSFNPVHKAHIALVNYLLNNNYLDKVIIVPTGDYWNKQNLINIDDRINMLKFYENDDIIINNELNNMPYTYQIIEKLQINYHNDQLLLIIGSDNIEKFHLWKNYEQLLQNEVLVIPRGKYKLNKNINKELRNSFKIITNYKTYNISSSLIRNKFINNDLNDILNLIDINIYEYIIENNLYKNME